MLLRRIGSLFGYSKLEESEVEYYHTENENVPKGEKPVYHSNPDCPAGAQIPKRNKIVGQGKGRVQCEDC